jgi:hypothetical protein
MESEHPGRGKASTMSHQRPASASSTVSASKCASRGLDLCCPGERFPGRARGLHLNPVVSSEYGGGNIPCITEANLGEERIESRRKREESGRWRHCLGGGGAIPGARCDSGLRQIAFGTGVAVAACVGNLLPNFRLAIKCFNSQVRSTWLWDG